VEFDLQLPLPWQLLPPPTPPSLSHPLKTNPNVSTMQTIIPKKNLFFITSLLFLGIRP
jgi:hypothetical protein